MDPNKRARDEFAIARARKLFVDAVNAKQAGLRDRFGRMLTEGDQVLVTFAQPPIMQVQSIVPVLDPSVPPGHLKMVLTCTIPYVHQANQALASIVTIMQGVPVTAAAATDESAPDTPPEVADLTEHDAPPVGDEEPNDPAAAIITDPGA